MNTTTAKYLGDWAIRQREIIKIAANSRGHTVRLSLEDFLHEAPWTQDELDALEQALVFEPKVFDDDCVWMVKMRKPASAEESQDYWMGRYNEHN